MDYGNGVVISYTYDPAGNRLTYSGVVSGDTTPPTIAINSPTSDPTFTTSSATVSLSGTTSDNTGVALITWANNRGGIGVASVATSWSISGIRLQTGDNVISVTAHDAAGNSSTATITVTLLVDVPTHTISLSTSPSDEGTVSGAGAFPVGSSRTVTAIPNPGYFFTSWTEGAAVVSSSANYSFSVNADRMLTANFLPGLPTHNGPSLPEQPGRALTDLTQLLVTNIAIDTDLPALALSYQLVNAPSGAAIDANGVISWTPTLTQSPSANVFTTIVTDDGVPPLSATNSFTVVVSGAYDGIDLTDASQASADTDGDGLPNLVEFALGTDPRNPADAREGMTVSLTQDGGGYYAELSFRQRNDTSGLSLQYVPEVSGDLQTWYSGGTHLTQVSLTPLDAYFDLVTVRDQTPATPTGPRFVRLRVVSDGIITASPGRTSTSAGSKSTTDQR